MIITTKIDAYLTMTCHKNEQEFLHREDGPAYVVTDNEGNVSIEVWFVNGYCHRLDGPAEMHYSKKDGKEIFSKYYVEGAWCDKAEFNIHPLVQEYKLNQAINKELL
jgi:hypothetical protein